MNEFYFLLTETKLKCNCRSYDRAKLARITRQHNLAWLVKRTLQSSNGHQRSGLHGMTTFVYKDVAEVSSRKTASDQSDGKIIEKLFKKFDNKLFFKILAIN
jgi:hypothetical protein